MASAALRAEPAGGVLTMRYDSNTDATPTTTGEFGDAVGLLANGTENFLTESGKSDGGDIGFLTHDNSSKSQF